MCEIDSQEVQKFLDDMKSGEIGPATFVLPNGEVKRAAPSEVNDEK